MRTTWGHACKKHAVLLIFVKPAPSRICWEAAFDPKEIFKSARRQVGESGGMVGMGVSLGWAVMLAAMAVPRAYLFPIIAVIVASFAG